MIRVPHRPAAYRDLVEAYRYDARQGGARLADRFSTQAEATFARLAGMPRIGTLHEADEALFADLRYFPISRFRGYLVFDRPLPDGIEVFRTLHGARDFNALLADELGVEEDDDLDAL